MNWELVKWVAGTLLTVAGVKFVWTAFRTIFSKDNMEDALDALGDKCSEGAERTGEYLKRKMVKHKIKKQAEKDKKNGKVIAYIR